MKTFVIAAAAALLLGSTAVSTLHAQEAEGAQQEILKQPAAPSASEAAPGQKQKSGEAGSAMEVTPGNEQKAGETTAREVAPGQVKTQDRAAGQTQAQPEQSTSETAPDPLDKPAEMKADESAPGKAKPSDEANETTKPSSETTASIDMSAEQRSEIRNVIVETKAEPVDIDFEVNVGVLVPRTVTLAPLPPRVIEIVPAYSGYDYFVLADGRIVIVEPGTLKVVHVLVV